MLGQVVFFTFFSFKKFFLYSFSGNHIQYSFSIENISSSPPHLLNSCDPHINRLSPLCFTVCTVQSLWWSWSRQRQHAGPHLIQTDLALLQRTGCQDSSAFFSCSLANLGLAVLCWFVSVFFLGCHPQRLTLCKVQHTVWAITKISEKKPWAKLHALEHLFF